LPDFSPKLGKIYQMTAKYTEWHEHLPNGIKNLPNGHKMCQHLPLQAPPKITKSGIFGFKINHLATLLGGDLLRLINGKLVLPKNKSQSHDLRNFRAENVA
jgi:hypothetical protein